MTGALDGLRVLDMSRILAGPFACQMLGDMGAEIIKVERPGRGDDSRRFGPPFMKDAEGRDTQESSFFLGANRNKRSVSIDVARPEGQALVRALAMRCDVLVENFKVGDLERHGLDYASLSKLNPRLVYCSITGFGQTGPYRLRPGYDSVFQGMGGMMSVTGHPDDHPGRGPMKTGPSLADVIAGLNAAVAILAAVHHRDVNGGQGQHIDIALLDTLVAANSHYAAHYLLSGDVPIRRGTEGNGGMPSRMFHCADGDVMIVAGNNEQYRRMCAVLGRPELGTDPRFIENADRVVNRRELGAELEPLYRRRNVAELVEAMNEANVPAGPVYDLKQVFDDAHVRSRGMRVEIAHPVSPTGTTSIVASPLRMSGTPVERYVAPPRVGEHTREVLGELLGLGDAEIDALREQRIV